MTAPSPVLEALLVEVEATAASIMQSELAALDDDLAARTLACCSRIRGALIARDAAGAALAAIQVGEWLAKLRDNHVMVQHNAAHKPRVQRDHERDQERRTVYKKYHEQRGFSVSKADEKAAAELGVSPRAIRRARNGN
jgi:hypothetical protein